MVRPIYSISRAKWFSGAGGLSGRSGAGDAVGFPMADSDELLDAEDRFKPSTRQESLDVYAVADDRPARRCAIV
jgi:hypothetical protein